MTDGIVYVGGARSQGREFFLTMKAKISGAAVMCRSQERANFLMKTYGVKAQYYESSNQGTALLSKSWVEDEWTKADGGDGRCLSG